MSNYVYLLIVSIALGIMMFTVVAIVSPASGNFLSSNSPSKELLTSEVAGSQYLVLDALPITETPLTSVTQPKNDWLQLPQIPSFIEKEASEPYAMEIEEDERELDLSILTAILGIVLSLYK